MSATDLETKDISRLISRLARETPTSGHSLTTKEYSSFSSFPIGKPTLSGLTRGKFVKCTEIQRQVLLHALSGRDVLGAAKTGSGKTLAFVVPLVEDLFRERTCKEDGLVGMIVSPTRELALQIFEVVKVVTHAHAFSCGLVVGGTDFAKEQQGITRMQIVVCTPGRILQHLEQTPMFDVSSTLRVLVLDEADRLLDLGFKEQLDALLSYMPAPRADGGTRQTLLFSATQTKSVADLAKLSLRDPEFVSVHAQSKEATPNSLKQSYVVCGLGDKIDMVYSFIRSHLRSKTIVFLSSCKQVKFLDAAFRRLRPGVPMMALHGKQTAVKRTLVYENFCSKPHAVLLATDIAARGLDFPDVDWVVQADCPEDVASYIHRVGRTARFKKAGNALLLLLPSEEQAFLKDLEKGRVPISKLGMNPRRKESVQEKLRGLLVADTELKATAQRAFKSYLRSVHLQTNKAVFDVSKLAFREYAASLGLPSAPRIRFASALSGEKGRRAVRDTKNVNRKVNGSASENEGEECSEGGEVSEDEEEDRAGKAVVAKRAPTNKWEKIIKRKANKSAKPTSDDEDDESSDEEFLVAKNRTKKEALLDEIEIQQKFSKNQMKNMRKIKLTDDLQVKGKNKSQKILFDEESGDAIDPFAELSKSLLSGEASSKKTGDIDKNHFVDRVAKRLKEEDTADREADRKRVKDMRLQQKIKIKGLKEEQAREDAAAQDDDSDDGGGARVAVLGPGSGSEDEGSSDGGAGNDDGDQEQDKDFEAKALKLMGKSKR